MSLAVSDASDSSFSAGRFAKAPLVGAKTVQGPAAIRKIVHNGTSNQGI